MSEQTLDSKDKEKTEKLKFLYEFQLKQYEFAKAQSIRLDDKASKFLTFISLIAAIIGVFAKYYFFDLKNQNLFDSISIFLIILLFIFVLCISRWLLICLKVGEVGKLPSDISMQKYIKENSKNTVYEELSSDLGEIILMYDEKNKEKVEFLGKAFKETLNCGIILLLLLCTIIISVIIHMHSTEKLEETQQKPAIPTAPPTLKPPIKQDWVIHTSPPATADKK